LKCSAAKQLTKIANGKAIWSEEEYLQKNVGEGTEDNADNGYSDQIDSVTGEE
jgi:hypothetical protein